MYICYADDSGDNTSRSITAVLVEDKNWSSLMAKWLQDRAYLTKTWGVRKHAELHALELGTQRGSFCETEAQERLFVHDARRRAYEIMTSSLTGIEGLITFTVASREKRLPIVYALFIDKLEQWAASRQTHVMVLLDGPDGNAHFDGESNSETRQKKWVAAQKQAQPYRRVHRDLDIAVRRVIEDVIRQDSKHSQMIQASDLVAYAAFHDAKRRHPDRWNRNGPNRDVALAAHQRLRSTWPIDSDHGVYWIP